VTNLSTFAGSWRSTVPSDVPRGGRDGRRLIGGGLLLRRTPGMFTPLFVGVRLRAPAPGRLGRHRRRMSFWGRWLVTAKMTEQ